MSELQSDEWHPFLRKFVNRRPVALVKLTDRDCSVLLSTRKGMGEFTLNVSHDCLREVVAPCICLITGTRIEGFQEQESKKEITYIGVIRSKQATSTLDTRIKVERAARINPAVSRLGNAIEDARFAQLFAARLAEDAPVSRMSPKLSVFIIDVLAKTSGNHGALRIVASGLEPPPDDLSARYQRDAIEMALKVFGLGRGESAVHLELVKGKESRLVGARIMEDAVIEHDARSVPKYDLVGSDATGRAIFRKGQQTLEVITANRKRLEEAFGVDLIYVNHFHNNLVMVQYKMLEPGGAGGRDDWTYAEDRHLSKQLTAMQRFARHTSGDGAYRLSQDFFYFKFVRRYGALDKSFLVPLEHFRYLAGRPRRPSRSKKLRLSYDALEGRYMRPTAFYSLLQSGYIGADSTTTGALKTLIDDLLSGGDALVVAIQRETARHEEDSDRARRIREWDDAESGYH